MIFFRGQTIFQRSVISAAENAVLLLPGGVAFDCYEKIEMVRRNNGHYRLDHAVTKKQKIILSSFGISEQDVFDSAAEISRLLAANQSLLFAADNEDKDEDKEDDFYGEDEIDFDD